MKYDITTNIDPEMPNLGKGTECIKLVLSQASNDVHDPLVPMLFPVLGAHISGAEFQYPDRSWKEIASRKKVTRLPEPKQLIADIKCVICSK
jgi:hypothetical protein